MTNLILAMHFIWDIVFHNTRYALSRVRGPVENYLTGLLWLFALGVGWPFILALLGVWWGWFTFVGFLGVWAFVFMVTLWVVGAPLGEAIDSLLSGPLTIPALWKRYRGGKLVTAEGYLSYGRTVLLYETFSLFFLSQIPINHSWRVAFGFVLGVFFLVCSGWEWRGKYGHWAKPLIRVAMLVIVLCQLAFFLKSAFLPKVEPVALVMAPVVTTNVVPVGPYLVTNVSTRVITSLKDVDNAVLTATAVGWLEWLQNHLTSPLFWLGFTLFAGFFTLLFLFLKKLAREGREAAAEAGDPAAKAATDRHTKTEKRDNHPGEKKNWVGIAIGVAVVLFLCALTYTMVAGFHSDHNLKVEESLARQRLYRAQEDAARIARIPPPRSVTPMLVQSGTTSSTASAPSGNGVVWKGLKNPTKYAVVFTNDMWSPRIPRPPRMAGRLEPNIRPIEVRVSRASDAPGTGRLYRAGETLKAEDAFLEYQFPENTNVVSVTIGIGYKAN
ncbi:MAG: hypothetical protein AAB767_01660 [Patescibacteria group bacterium]